MKKDNKMKNMKDPNSLHKKGRRILIVIMSIKILLLYHLIVLLYLSALEGYKTVPELSYPQTYILTGIRQELIPYVNDNPQNIKSLSILNELVVELKQKEVIVTKHTFSSFLVISIKHHNWFNFILL